MDGLNRRGLTDLEEETHTNAFRKNVMTHL